MLTGNVDHDRLEYLRLASHELNFAIKAYSSGRPMGAEIAIECMKRYLKDAAALDGDGR